MECIFHSSFVWQSWFLFLYEYWICVSYEQTNEIPICKGKRVNICGKCKLKNNINNKWHKKKLFQTCMNVCFLFRQCVLVCSLFKNHLWNTNEYDTVLLSNSLGHFFSSYENFIINCSKIAAWNVWQFARKYFWIMLFISFPSTLCTYVSLST